jgi:hypothetical protein
MFFLESGRQPHYFIANGRLPQKQMDDLNIFSNGRRPQLYEKRKTILIISK